MRTCKNWWPLLGLIVTAGVHAQEPAPDAAAPAPDAQTQAAAVITQEPAPAAEPVPEDSFFQGLPLTLGLFGNVDGAVGGPGYGSFVLGGVDLFATARPHRSVSLLAEVVFEAGSDQSFVVDVERLHGTWVFDPLLRVTAGRVHQALGYYNAAFHHGAYLATTIERPLAVAFEDSGGVLPVHAIGIEAAGELELGDFALGYELTVGNGRGRNPDEVLNIKDLNPAKSVLVGLHAKQIDWGVQLGINALYDRIPFERDGSGAEVKPPQDETILGAHLLVDRDLLWFLTEFYLVDHSSTSLGLRRTIGFFAEARINLRPVYFYGRVDAVEHSGEIDPFFDPAAPAPSVRGALLGVGWKITGALVLKVEGALGFSPGAPLTPSGRAQLAWTL